METNASSHSHTLPSAWPSALSAPAAKSTSNAQFHAENADTSSWIEQNNNKQQRIFFQSNKAEKSNAFNPAMKIAWPRQSCICHHQAIIISNRRSIAGQNINSPCDEPVFYTLFALVLHAFRSDKPTSSSSGMGAITAPSVAAGMLPAQARHIVLKNQTWNAKNCKEAAQHGA